MTNQHANNAPLSEKDDEFLDDENRMHLAHSKVKSMNDSAMLRYGENTLRQLTDRNVQNTMATLSKTNAKTRQT